MRGAKHTCKSKVLKTDGFAPFLDVQMSGKSKHWQPLALTLQLQQQQQQQRQRQRQRRRREEEEEEEQQQQHYD